MLNQLKLRNYITYQEEIKTKIFSVKFIDGEINLDKWFDNTDFNILLTIEGLEYLEKFKLIKTNILSNKASIKNLKSQKFGMYSTLILALIAILISFLNLYYDNKKNETIEKLYKQSITLQKQINYK